MEIVEKELRIEYANVKSVAASSKVTLAVAATPFAPAVAFRIYTGHSSGTFDAYLTGGGLDLLFPSDQAKPFKADAGVVNSSRFSGSTGTGNQMWASVNGTTTTPLNVTTSSQDKIDYGITNGIAGTIKSQANFRIYLKHSGWTVAVGGDGYFKLYFYRYAMSAVKIGNGLQSVSVSNTNPYEGESTTFTATLNSGATWNGWYSDAACTNLVSSSQSYTVNPSSDLTLYAKATRDSGTGCYLKTDGTWTEVQSVYKKVNGLWVEQADVGAVFDTTKKYIKG